MASMASLRPPTMRMDFNKTLILPTACDFTRAATGDYLDDLGATKTASINQPRMGYHLTDAVPRRGLVLGTGEVAWRDDVADWQKASTGTMLWVGTMADVATSLMLWGLTTSVANNYIRVRIDSATAGRLRLMCANGGSVQFTADLINPMLVDVRYKIAVAWSGTTFRAVVNDQLQMTDESATGIPAAFTSMAIGAPITNLSGTVMNGTIERMIYWPFAMGYTQMRALTR